MKKTSRKRITFGIICLALGVLGLVQELTKDKDVFPIFAQSMSWILIGIYLFLPKLPLIRFVSGIIILATGVLGFIQELMKGVLPMFHVTILFILVGVYLVLSTFFQRKENNFSQ